MPDRVGQQFGNYQLARLLGEGGFAEVYLGEHIHLGTQAAIKVLHTQLASDAVDKFRAEARIIARLVHPHIVRVLEFGMEGKTPFLVMDYAPHGTLRQRFPKGVALPLSFVIDCAEQIASALQLTGAYIGHNTFSGIVNEPDVSFACNQPGFAYEQHTASGTWTGTIDNGP